MPKVNQKKQHQKTTHTEAARATGTTQIFSLYFSNFYMLLSLTAAPNRYLILKCQKHLEEPKPEKANT